MVPPVVYEEWHAIFQAIFQGVEGPEWETIYYKCGELRKAAKCKKSGEHKKTKALWSLKEAKDKGIDCFDLGSVQKIQTRSQVRLDLCAIRLKSPTAALANALERTEHKNLVVPVVGNERNLKSEALGSYFSEHDGSNVFGG